MKNTFEYVNETYGLNLTKHCPVIKISTGQRGQVIKGKMQYVYIQWDGESKPRGPYHPTSNLKYI